MFIRFFRPDPENQEGAMWDMPILKITTALLSMVILIFPLGGMHPEVTQHPILNGTAVTPSKNEAVFSGDSGPFYLPVIFEGSLAWHCYQDQGKDCIKNNMISIKMVSPDEGWAVGAGGLIMHYINGSWRLVNSPTKNYLSSLSMVSPGEGWAVGDGGVILHYH
jgi:photosystem II stability/assembly factor-like uncharacterized protein